jgi:Icc-related predicted phosphoesterase
MRILLISDHISPKLNLREFVNNHNPDFIITLGDLSYDDLIDLKNIDLPKIGIYGNHCRGDYLSLLNIRNLHLKNNTISNTGILSGINFFGFEGCVKYKDGGSKQYDQNESIEMVSTFLQDKIDVVITHAPPFGINDSLSDPAHIGFDGLKLLIDKTNPAILFHGHTYPPENMKLSIYKNTVIYYVSGVELFDTSTIPDILPKAKNY